MCPNCDGKLRYKTVTSREPHGEEHTDEWFECSRCGSGFTLEEVMGGPVEDAE
jgi:C4-type Zn-finger protein